MTWSYGTVIDIERLSPRMTRIWLHLTDPERITMPDCGDDAVGLYFPADNSEVPPPMELRDGVWGYHDPGAAPPGRNYTVRRYDAENATAVIDFVVHGNGVATTWLRNAVRGNMIAVSHARSWYRPGTAPWQVLAADLTGLPALARIIEDLPDAVSATAVAEVSGKEDLDYLPVRENVSVVSCIGGNGEAPSGLADLIAAQPFPQGDGYLWFAGEAAQSRSVRKWLRAEHGWTSQRFDIVGYWRQGSEEWDRRFAEVGPQMLAIYREALAAGKSQKVALEEYDEALERVGL